MNIHKLPKELLILSKIKEKVHKNLALAKSSVAQSWLSAWRERERESSGKKELLVYEKGDTRRMKRERKMKTTIVDRMKQERKGEGRRYSNARLDDLSTYEKIAFYKLVSRKELEGIADARMGWLVVGRQGKGRKKGRVSRTLGERAGRREGKRKRPSSFSALGQSSLNWASSNAKSLLLSYLFRSSLLTSRFPLVLSSRLHLLLTKRDTNCLGT